MLSNVFPEPDKIPVNFFVQIFDLTLLHGLRKLSLFQFKLDLLLEIDQFNCSHAALHGSVKKRDSSIAQLPFIQILLN